MFRHLKTYKKSSYIATRSISGFSLRVLLDAEPSRFLKIIYCVLNTISFRCIDTHQVRCIAEVSSASNEKVLFLRRSAATCCRGATLKHALSMNIARLLAINAIESWMNSINSQKWISRCIIGVSAFNLLAWRGANLNSLRAMLLLLAPLPQRIQILIEIYVRPINHRGLNVSAKLSRDAHEKARRKSEQSWKMRLGEP